MAKQKKRREPSKSRSGSLVGNALLVRFLIIAVFVFLAVYAIISLTNINIQLDAKKQELKELENQIEVQELKNEEMERLNNYTGDELSDYIEQLARDELDYIKQGERIFVNVSGD